MTVATGSKTIEVEGLTLIRVRKGLYQHIDELGRCWSYEHLNRKWEQRLDDTAISGVHDTVGIHDTLKAACKSLAAALADEAEWSTPASKFREAQEHESIPQLDPTLAAEASLNKRRTEIAAELTLKAMQALDVQHKPENLKQYRELVKVHSTFAALAFYHHRVALHYGQGAEHPGQFVELGIEQYAPLVYPADVKAEPDTVLSALTKLLVTEEEALAPVEMVSTAIALIRYARQQAAYWAAVETVTKVLLTPVIEEHGKYTDELGHALIAVDSTTPRAKADELMTLANTDPKKYGWLVQSRGDNPPLVYLGVNKGGLRVK